MHAKMVNGCSISISCMHADGDVCLYVFFFFFSFPSQIFHSDTILMQGVFINPAFIEPFGLTLIEVLTLYI
jgi:hypothetical protein